MRRIQAQGAEERRRTLEAITAVFTHLGSGGAALLADPKKLVIEAVYERAITPCFVFKSKDETIPSFIFSIFVIDI